ncbi:MAG: hypothetical protein ACREMV_00235 [Gemmatimonadales bacterium]
MALYVVAFVTAVFAALGAARLERGEGRGHLRAWLGAAAAVAALALAGAFGNVALALAPPERAAAAAALGPTIRVGALLSALGLGAAAILGLGHLRERIPVAAWATLLPLVIGADLWRDGRHFWHYQTPPRQGLHREDPVVAHLHGAARPYRAFDLGVYPLNVLQGHDVPQVLGYFGFELRYYDELLGGKNEWRYLLRSTQLWNLLAVRFVIAPDTMHIPGYHRVMGPVPTAVGRQAYLYEADTAPPYARVVPSAITLAADQIPATLADPRLPGYDRVVLLPQDAPVDPAELQRWPQPSASHATVTAWHPGAMTIALDPAPPATSYVLVAENWYPDWRATVDGRPAAVVRGNHTLIVVPVPAGARSIGLEFRSAEYARGKLVSLTSLALVLLGFVASAVVRRRRGG